MSHRAIGEERNEILRAIVREVIERDFAGNMTAAAKRFKVTPAAVHDFLSGKRGAGMKLIDGIVAQTGRSLEGLLGGSSDPVGSDEPRHANMPGWREAEAAVKAERDIPPWIWDKARRARGLAPPTGVTIEWVRDLVMDLWKHMPRAEQADAENAILDKRIATLKKREENKALRELAPKNDAPTKPANDRATSKKPVRNGAKKPKRA